MFANLDLIGIPNRKVGGSAKYALAAEQEQFVVDRLRETYAGVEWHTTTEYMGGVMNPEQNKILGDIIGIRKDKDNMMPDIFIDLKTTEYRQKNYLVGSINLDSITGFGYKQKNHFYVCTNYDGSDFIVVDSKDVYDLLYNTNEKCLRESYWHDSDAKYAKFENRFIHAKTTIGVSGKDYMPSTILRKFDKRKGEA